MGLVKISFSYHDYLLMLDGADDVDSFLSALFLDPINHQRIVSELNNYHSDEDGAPIVSDFKIAEITHDEPNDNGKVRFAYSVDFTFACADKRATTNHFEISNFTINPDEGILSLFIHDKISRDTYEEF